MIRADGVPLIMLDGEIKHFVPLNHATGDEKARIAQMTVEYLAGRGGWAWSEWVMPLDPK